MASQALDRYVELKQQISELEKELELLKDDVFKVVDRKGGEVEADNFVIRSYKTPKYKFSEIYTQKNTELKALRKSEIEDGSATVDGYSEFVKLNFKKPKENEA